MNPGKAETNRCYQDNSIRLFALAAGDIFHPWKPDAKLFECIKNRPFTPVVGDINRAVETYGRRGKVTFYAEMSDSLNPIRGRSICSTH